MATVNYISYKTQNSTALKGVLAYVSKLEKVMINREDVDQKHDLDKYGHIKSDCIKLVSGLNCTAESVYQEFLSTKASYNKNGGVQFYHYTQSFKVGEEISPQLAHQIALEFAEKHYGDFEVLVATHVDARHLHSHFIINSVSFEHGKKLRQSPSTLKMLRANSDEICKKYGLTTLEPYTHGRRQSRGETKAQKKGTSWKFDLCLAIENQMKKCKSKEEFIANMEQLGYQVKWTDSRKNITYTCPNGRKVRDDKLYGKKYLKENMEKEFKLRMGLEQSAEKTGWEYERASMNQQQGGPSKETLDWGRNVMYSLGRLERAGNFDDDFGEMLALVELTALSTGGICLLVDWYKNLQKNEKISIEQLEIAIEEIKMEPENNFDFQDEMEEEGPIMSM